MKASMRLVLLAVIAWLSGPPVTRGLAGPVKDARQAARCGQADSILMAVVCATCRDVWDRGSAYWRWGYSAGVWDVPSGRNWPGTPYFQPSLKHLCAECAARPK
jgi:hypothetical protein